MSDRFDFTRFGKYYAYDFKRCASNVGLGTLLASLSGVFCYILYNILYILLGGEWKCFEYPVEARKTIFVITAIFFLIITASRLYGGLTDKRQGTSFLMIPSSSGEKFASMLLNVTIVYPLIFMAIYWLGDVLICLIDGRLAGHLNVWINPDFGQSLFYADEGGMSSDQKMVSANFGFCLGSALGLICTQLEFLLGSLIFKKHKVTKTILSLIGISIVFSIVAIFVIQILIEAFDGIDLDFDPDLNIAVWLMTAVQFLIDVGLAWLCYWRFRRIRH